MDSGVTRVPILVHELVVVTQGGVEWGCGPLQCKHGLDIGSALGGRERHHVLSHADIRGRRGALRRRPWLPYSGWPQPCRTKYENGQQYD